MPEKAMTKKQMERKLRELAKLKADKKELEDHVKDVEAEIINDPNCPEKFNSNYGTLKYAERENYGVPDNFQLIEKSVITKSIFIQNATMSAGKIKNIVGEEQFNNLLKQGIIAKKNKSCYFQLVT